MLYSNETLLAVNFNAPSKKKTTSYIIILFLWIFTRFEYELYIFQ